LVHVQGLTRGRLDDAGREGHCERRSIGELIGALKLRGRQIAVDGGRQAVGIGVHITDGDSRAGKHLARDSHVKFLHARIFEIGGEPERRHRTSSAGRQRAQHVRKCGSERIGGLRRNGDGGLRRIDQTCLCQGIEQDAVRSPAIQQRIASAHHGFSIAVDVPGRADARAVIRGCLIEILRRRNRRIWMHDTGHLLESQRTP